MTKEILMYNDEIKLLFTEASHRYKVCKKSLKGGWLKPESVAGVTTILGYKAKPSLIPWAASEASKEFARLVLKHEGELTKETVENMQTLAKSAHLRKKDTAADIGSLAHKCFEDYLKSKIVPTFDATTPPQVISSWDGFEKYWKKTGFICAQAEQVVYSRDLHFCGTFDFLARDKMGRLYIGDFKTTKTSAYAPNGIYVENFYQMGGYARAFYEEFGEEIHDLICINVGKEDGVIREDRASRFGMTVLDAVEAFESIHHAWKTNKEWEYNFKK